MQEQLQKVTEEIRRKDREQQEHMRQSRRLKDEQDCLQKHKDQLEEELQELRY